jgi:cytochrome c6
MVFSMTLAKRIAFPALASMAFLTGSVAFGQAGGEATFKQQCAMCHGADGSGNTGMGKTLKLRDLKSPEVQKMSDSELVSLIAKGKGRMPAYESKLGDEKIKAVVAHLRELAKK